jgi:DNA-binding NarL/FixJ family response regulator
MQPKTNILTRNQRDILTILLLDKGRTYKAIAEALPLDDDTIRRDYKINLEGGKEA